MQLFYLPASAILVIWFEAFLTTGTLPLLPQQLASWLISVQDSDDEAEDRCSGHSV